MVLYVQIRGFDADIDLEHTFSNSLGRKLVGSSDIVGFEAVPGPKGMRRTYLGKWSRPY